ncbi:schwannomin-interacting protein 1 [Coregonus clupeaformis]|uniref:schwannomin-interacting protein 1 n=1 Tax=Coregonus clupeaformis TaxID=59861 RepID=UPI001E1C6CE4|nr:schwannomin-interacting protein 1 [Coregonus clupeaformis]XP_041724212.2 schwannomin-interacting protein 1 [Coregonus clupeaformis]
MEGEKERERERGEEKESDETEEDDEEEEDDEDAEGAALVWQEGSYGEDDLGLPIMHWEALSLRIAELEKQEEEKREKKTKSSSVLERGKKLLESRPLERDGGESKENWEDGGEAEDCNSRVTALTSRLSNQMNLQLCFINDSGSEEEEEDSGETICAKNSKMVVKNGSNGSSVQVPHQPQSPAATKSKSSGFKAALSALKNRLRMEQKQESLSCGDQLLKNGKLDCRDLQAFSLKELNTHRNSLNKAIQDLSTELVVDLQTRDQLRTEQDAMLLEVQGMTSL